jgi:adhesin transport system outer membrane protein
MPASRDESLAVALRFNSTIAAAQSDVDAAKHAFKVTDGAFVPKFYLEGRATHYDNSFPYVTNPGLPNVTHEDYSGKVVMTWDIFRGGQDVWNRSEKAERFTEATMRHARLQRDAYESIDKAWNARTVTLTRIAALTRQLEADRKTIAAFQKEYELGQRSLIDLLNAQNQFFNASVSLTSARAVIIFADYQLLAAMGTLIEYLKAPPPVDAAPVDLLTFGLPAYGFPTLRVNLPQTGSEPLRVPVPVAAASAQPIADYGSTVAQTTNGFGDRWPQSVSNVPGASEWMAQQNGGSPETPTVAAGSYAETSPQKPHWKPHWLLSAVAPIQK